MWALIYEITTKSYVADFPAVFFIFAALIFVMKHNWQIQIQNHEDKSQLSRAINYGDNPPSTVGQSGEISQKLAYVYEFAFGGEVAKTAERMQGRYQLNMFLKSICEQNSIS